jgi:predicted RNA methylase
MFDKEFFPTPDSVLDLMVAELFIEFKDKIVLEPSSGSGNIIEYVKKHGAKKVLACEKNEDLFILSNSKADSMIGRDFFDIKATDISHIDIIIMNPPFSNADKHILHAFEIAPDGCVIYALCNSNTIDNQYSRDRGRLGYLIKDYGSSHRIGDVFAQDDSERKTDVSVSMLSLHKPKNSENEFEGYFDVSEEYQSNDYGIVKYDALKALVNQYVETIKNYDLVISVAQQMKTYSEVFGIKEIGVSLSYGNAHVNREEFVAHLKKVAWLKVLDLFNLDKFVTQEVYKKINKFVETKQNIPFTLKNVYKMVDIIIQTREQNLNESLRNIVDYFNQFTDKNRFMVQGWKTNSSYMLNEKFIVYVSYNYGGNYNKINDLLKILCYLTGKHYDDYKPFDRFVSDNKLTFGQEYEWGFFKIKCYQKGSVHLKFIDRNVWAILNRKYAEIVGQVLPEKIQ